MNGLQARNLLFQALFSEGNVALGVYLNSHEGKCFHWKPTKNIPQNLAILREIVTNPTFGDQVGSRRLNHLAPVEVWQVIGYPIIYKLLAPSFQWLALGFLNHQRFEVVCFSGSYFPMWLVQLSTPKPTLWRIHGKSDDNMSSKDGVFTCFCFLTEDTVDGSEILHQLRLVGYLPLFTIIRF